MSQGERLQPADFTYEGAFRLPDDFNWGALGLSFYPNGDRGVDLADFGKFMRAYAGA